MGQKTCSTSEDTPAVGRRSFEQDNGSEDMTSSWTMGQKTCSTSEDTPAVGRRIGLRAGQWFRRHDFKLDNGSEDMFDERRHASS